jgi:endonuclease/exonuclease/phosphatase (EEP) superfamily protein YafD
MCQGDEWWPGTFLMFFPRWIWLVPAAVVLVAGVVSRRRSMLPAAVALIVALGPVMGLCLPWRPLMQAPPTGLKLRVVTCNMHYGKTDPGPLDALAQEVKPDILALQEWRDSARAEEWRGTGWHVHRARGLCLASRYPIRRTEHLGNRSSSPSGSAMLYEIETSQGMLTVISLHLESPREGLGQAASGGIDGLRANSELRRQQSEHVAGAAAQVTGPLLIVGDFNTPPESVLFRRVWTGYVDAFDEAGLGWGYTFIIRRTDVRIDHILVGGSGHASHCWVGPDVGSPHRPVIADVAWP